MRFYNGNVYVRATLRGRQASKQAGTKKVIAYFRLNGKTQTLYAIMCYVTRCIEIFVDSCIDRSWSNAFTLSTLSHFHFLYIIWCVNRICIFSRVSFFLASTSIRNKRTGSKAHKELEAHILDNVFFSSSLWLLLPLLFSLNRKLFEYSIYISFKEWKCFDVFIKLLHLHGFVWNLLCYPFCIYVQHGFQKR